MNTALSSETDTPKSPVMPLYVKLALAYLLCEVSRSIASLLLAPSVGSLGSFLKLALGSWLFWNLFIKPLLQGEGRTRCIIIFSLIIMGVLAAIWKEAWTFFSDPDSIATEEGASLLIHQTLELTFCAYVLKGFWGNKTDLWFSGPRAVAKPDKELTICMLAAMTLFQLDSQTSEKIQARERRGLEPTIPEIMLVDSESGKPLAEIELLPSKSAPHGMDDSFNKRHHPCLKSFMVGKNAVSTIHLKTIIAEPLKLRFGSDGYEPADIVIQPGHVGKIELALKPLTGQPSAEKKP